MAQCPVYLLLCSITNSEGGDGNKVEKYFIHMFGLVTLKSHDNIFLAVTSYPGFNSIELHWILIDHYLHSLDITQNHTDSQGHGDFRKRLWNIRDDI